MFRNNGLLWSLALFAMTVPLIDRLLRGSRYRWNLAAKFAHADVEALDATRVAVPSVYYPIPILRKGVSS